MNLTIYTDGGARGNPGPAAIGIVIKNEYSTLKEYKEFIGKATNNVAEYAALVKALTLAKIYSPKKIDVYMDSELIIRQLTGKYSVKQPQLILLYKEVKSLEKNFNYVAYHHIKREKNFEADALVNAALDENYSKSYRTRNFGI